MRISTVESAAFASVQFSLILSELEVMLVLGELRFPLSLNTAAFVSEIWNLISRVSSAD